ncbi:MAG: FkbM family methyltransferase [Bacteroidales bacterium]|jgi:FkbM family methyltransferase|nr:FkbM family methyltransferase [Bacteroidales bacterium]
MNFIIDLFYKILRLPKVLKGKDILFFVQKKVKTITLGNKGASWTLSNEHINKNSIIYSFGVGTDNSFDVELINRFGTKIYAFDPTPKSIQWVKDQNLPKEFVFQPYGVAAESGEIEFTLPENSNYVSGSIHNVLGSKGTTIKVPVKSLEEIMSNLSHSQIDILKMDIEGSEYEVIDCVIDKKIPVKQILVEFHHRFPAIGIAKSKIAINKLNLAGYKIFHVSVTGEEYSFIKD